jgi:excisionase family DNA binding protein
MNKEGRRWLTIKETAEKLGLHPITAYRLAGRGEIPCAKIGGNLLVDWLTLERQLEAQVESRLNQKLRGKT